MPAFLRSLLVMLLGAAPSPDAPGAARRASARVRRYLRSGTEPGGDGAVEIEERSRRHARVPRFTWAGEAIIETGDRALTVPGTWALELDPRRGGRRSAIGHVPALDLGDAEAWLDHLTTLLTLQVPGSSLRIVSADAAGWRTLELRAPSRPETVVEFDRDALRQVLQADSRITLRVLG